MIKLTIKDLPISVDDSAVIEILREHGARSATKLIQGFYRNKQGKLSTVGNGDRIAYLHKKEYEKITLPKKAMVSNFVDCFIQQCLEQPVKHVRQKTIKQGTHLAPTTLKSQIPLPSLTRRTPSY